MNQQTPHPDQADKPVVLLGGGGHARVLISLLRLIGRPIVAVLDDDPAKHGSTISDAPITGALDTVTQHNPDDIELVNAIGSANRPAARMQVSDRMAALGYRFATLVHPLAVIAPDVTIDPGAQVMASVTLQTGVKLASNCLINTGAVIDHDTAIGSGTHVAPGVTICGGVEVGEGCHIGAGATVIQGVTIASGVVVAAGATVVKDVGPDQVVGGTPAKPING